MSKWILERSEEAAAPLSSPSAPPTSPMSGVHGFSAGIAGGKVPPETAKLLQSEVEALGAVDVNNKCLGRVMGEWLLKLREAHTGKRHTSIPVCAKKTPGAIHCYRSPPHPLYQCWIASAHLSGTYPRNKNARLCYK